MGMADEWMDGLSWFIFLCFPFLLLFFVPPLWLRVFLNGLYLIALLFLFLRVFGRGRTV